MPKTWESRVILYCTYLVEVVKLQSSTIKSYISGIKKILEEDGYEWNIRKALLNTITKTCKLKNDRITTRLPIGKHLLEMIIIETKKLYKRQPYLEKLYIAVFSLCYYGLLRVGEVSQSQHSIKAVDIHEGNNRNRQKLLIILRSSKTHTKGDRPQQIRIIGNKTINVIDNAEIPSNHKKQSTQETEFSTRGKFNTIFCPVKCFKEFTAVRPRIKSLQEQIFIFRDGSPLKAEQLRRTLRTILARLRLDPSIYDTHSFRIGRATDLEKLNVDIESIKRLGRWRSNAVYKYLRN